MKEDADKIIDDLTKNMNKEVFGLIADMYTEFRRRNIPAIEASNLVMQFVHLMINENKEGKK